MIVVEIVSIILAPILIGVQRKGEYNFGWWLLTFADSVIVILLSLKVLGKI